MKHFYLPVLVFFLLFSCSKTEPVTGNPDPEGEDPEPEDTLEACFSLSSETVFVGETLEISNCSEGASTYFFDFGNGDESTDDNPSVTYEEGGEYIITLTVSKGDAETDTYSLPILVASAESFYIYPDVPEGYSFIPLETGIHPVNGRIYSIELREEPMGPGGSKFYFRDLYENFSETSYYIADKPYNSNSAFVNFLAGGNQNIHFPRTLAALYGSQELMYNGSWGFISNINPSDKHSYGYLPNGADYLYYGTADDNGTYKAAFEHRNGSGDAFRIDLIPLGEGSSMIADMIEVAGGYVAYGGVFNKNELPPYISEFRPVLAFFDTSLNLTSEVVIQDSQLDGKISSSNDLNGSYHLEKLSNGNLVFYGNGELILTSSGGALIKQEYFEETSAIQALVSLGTEFVISTNNYLRIFDANGNQLRELKYGGNYMPELLRKDGKLLFVAGYDTEDGTKLFYGAVDLNLNLIPLGT